MSNIRLTKLARAIRAQLGTSTSIAVGVALISTTAAHAKAIPQLLPDSSLFQMENAIANRELVFIDADVPESGRLLVGIKQGMETVILDRNKDGIEQITEVLETYTDIAAVHIVAHGEAGLLKLGSTRLDTQGLNDKAVLLRRWFTGSSNSQPDLLLYACDVAKGSEGAAFVEQLAVLTGADIAASDDKTGAAGDWDLEYSVGHISTPLAFKEEELAAYPHNLATFTVTKTADTNDGTCDVDCSLREAVAAANATIGTDTITFDASVTGTIVLALGQIDITDDLVMDGPGAAVLTVSGDDSDRIFDFSASSFTLRNLTLTAGSATGDGGAIRTNCCSTELRIEDSVITGNTASGDGGGIYQDEGDVYIIRSEISNNHAYGDGGGVDHRPDGGSDDLVIIDSLISNNVADRDGGGISFYGDDDGGNAVVFNSVITGNTAGGDGGGMMIYADDEGYYVYITDSTISDNSAGDEGGGVFHYTDDDGYLVVNNSTISGNTAGEGGGIWFYSDDGRLDVNNSTISGNSATYDGGGIMVDEASSGAQIRNSTIVFNDAGDEGGGIRSTFEDVYVSNSIIAENTASYGPDIYGTRFYLTYSLLGDTTDATFNDNGGNILDVASGVLPTLVDAGGPTRVHLLSPDSPAKDAGQPGFTDFEYDQRGVGYPRVVGNQMDMGAVEMSPQVYPDLLPVPTLQNWALILLGLLMPAVALRWRGKLELRQARKRS